MTDHAYEDRPSGRRQTRDAIARHSAARQKRAMQIRIVFAVLFGVILIAAVIWTVYMGAEQAKIEPDLAKIEQAGGADAICDAVESARSQLDELQAQAAALRTQIEQLDAQTQQTQTEYDQIQQKQRLSEQYRLLTERCAELEAKCKALREG